MISDLNHVYVIVMFMCSIMLACCITCDSSKLFIMVQGRSVFVIKSSIFADVGFCALDLMGGSAGEYIMAAFHELLKLVRILVEEKTSKFGSISSA